MLKKIIILVFVTCFACFNTVFAAESGGMPQLNPEFWISQIFWLIITFGILFIVLTKVILPKISDNLETRKSQILENIETADKQKEESQKKIDEYEKIILESKIKAKNYFNDAREKILEDINKKRAALEKDLDEEISSTENELSEFKKSSGDKVIKIAAETSAELIKELIGEGVNSSSIAAIVEDQAKMNKERKDVI
jgi:F-type H+-transporting ATPase subunit b